jgi:hypothetical protein
MMTNDITRKAYREPAKTEPQQANRGRFRPGQSGNPKGRPVGSRHKATLAALALLGNDLEAITEKLVQKAKAGEQWAVKLVIDKLIPNARDLPVAFKAPKLETSADLRGALVAILKGVSQGKITPDEGQAVAALLNGLGLALMVEELETQLEHLQGERR